MNKQEYCRKNRNSSEQHLYKNKKRHNNIPRKNNRTKIQTSSINIETQRQLISWKIYQNGQEPTTN